MQPRCASTECRQVSTAVVPRFYATFYKSGIKKSRYAASVKGKKKRKSVASSTSFLLFRHNTLEAVGFPGTPILPAPGKGGKFLAASTEVTMGFRSPGLWRNVSLYSA